MPATFADLITRVFHQKSLIGPIIMMPVILHGCSAPESPPKQQGEVLPAAPPTPPKPRVEYKVGDEVELIGTNGADVSLSSDRAVHHLKTSFRTRVVEVSPDQVKVGPIDPGSIPEDFGWISRDEVRPAPTREEMAADMVDGLDQNVRRMVYLETHQAAHRAGLRAEPTPRRDRYAYQVYQKAFAAEFEETQKRFQTRLFVDLSVIKRIELEGEARRWPSR